MTDILEAVRDACDRTPHAPAITLGRHTLSYGGLRDRVNSIASCLISHGMKPGDRVLFSVRPGIDAVCLALGIISAGGTVVFADPGAGEAMFRARSALAAPKWVAAESVLYAASSGPLRSLARRRGIELPDYGTVVPDARHIYTGPWLPGVPRAAVPLRRLIGSQGDRIQTPSDHAALIIFTSGTTAHPKAVVHSRVSLGTGLNDFARHAGFLVGERVLTDQLMVGIPALISGAHWVMPPPGADPGAKPAAYLDLLPSADVLFAVPAALDALLRMLERTPAAAPSLRALIIGGAPVLRPLLLRARAQLPRTAIRAVYGMTEILPVAIADGDEKLSFEGAGDYVGEIMPTIDASIVDGELVLRGEGLAGYLGEPAATELRTGDLARIEGDRLVLAGRNKDMFIRGTTNVYPGLYEPVIAGIPGVEQAALVGLPDEIGDDSIVLAVVLTKGGTIDQVRRALPGLIDSAVLPDRIVAMDAFPTTGRSAKLDRTALAAQLA